MRFKRTLRQGVLVVLGAAAAVMAAEDIDGEILKNFEFFSQMDVIENLDLASQLDILGGNDADAANTEPKESDKSPKAPAQTKDQPAPAKRSPL